MLSIISGLGAAILLLTAGYLFGVRRGALARERLRAQTEVLATDLDRMRVRSSERDAGQDLSLRTTIQHVLAPLVERERISLDLAQFTGGGARRRDLVPLLDKIAAVGRFSTVLLANEEGLPLAANSAADDIERLAASSTRLALAAGQIAGEQGVSPRSVMLRDASDATTLCRMFRVQDQQLTLTAVSSDARLTSVALDPALSKIDVALWTPS